MKLTRTILLALCLVTLALYSVAAEDAGTEAGDDAPTAEAGADAPAEEAAGTILFRLKYEEGEVLTYETTLDGVGSVHIAGNQQALDMDGEMLVMMTVEEVDEEGNFTVLTEVDVEKLTVTMAGSPMPPPDQEIKVRTEMTPRGEILDIEMVQDQSQQADQGPWNEKMAKMLTGGFDLKRMLMGQKIAAFPEDPVSPGDEWTGQAQEVDVEGQTAPLQITTKYDGNIEVDGRMCARLDSTCDINAEAFGEMATTLDMSGTTSTQTRSWFDFEAGRMVATMERTQANMQVQMPTEMTGAQQPVPVFLEMFVTAESKLLPSGEEN